VDFLRNHRHVPGGDSIQESPARPADSGVTIIGFVPPICEIPC
jgi:hypothetical protein